VEIDELRLAYTDRGPKNAPCAILLIHGHPFDRTMWNPQMESLASEYRVVAPDLRGYGQSSLPNGTRVTTLDPHARDCPRAAPEGAARQRHSRPPRTRA
jgi:3-oxoadipate enol-lactonase